MAAPSGLAFLSGPAVSQHQVEDAPDLLLNRVQLWLDVKGVLDLHRPQVHTSASLSSLKNKNNLVKFCALLHVQLFLHVPSWMTAWIMGAPTTSVTHQEHFQCLGTMV